MVYPQRFECWRHLDGGGWQTLIKGLSNIADRPSPVAENFVSHGHIERDAYAPLWECGHPL